MFLAVARSLLSSTFELNLNAHVALTRARVWCVVTGVEAPIFDKLHACEEQYPKFTFPAFNKRTIQSTNDENENSNENA